MAKGIFSYVTYFLFEKLSGMNYKGHKGVIHPNNSSVKLIHKPGTMAILELYSSMAMQKPTQNKTKQNTSIRVTMEKNDKTYIYVSR